MSKIQLFLLSLIGAGPAGLLSYLLVMYLIDQPTGANSTVMIFAILTLLCTAPLTLLPLLILAMYYSNYDPPKVPKAPKKKKEEAEDEADAEADAEEDEGDSKKKKGKSKKKDEDEDEDGDEGIIDDLDEDK